MSARAQPDRGRAREKSPGLAPLRAPGEELSAKQLVEALGLWQRPHPGAGARPYVLLNMISSVDGRATLGGHSGPLGDSADRALFHALRCATDGVLAGAGTVRMERYGLLVRDQSCMDLRRGRGLPEQPLACIVSGRLALEEDIPLLADPDARVVVMTPSEASLPGGSAQIDYVRPRRGGLLDLPAALEELRARFGVQLLLCEGGPHLGAQLFAENLVDELFLSVAPLLAGGEPMAGEAVRIVAGAELDPPVALELLGALTGGSTLFLRYGVSARARVSRETTLSSSLAR